MDFKCDELILGKTDADSRALTIGEADSLEKLEALLPWNVPLEPIAKKVAQYNEGK